MYMDDMHLANGMEDMKSSSQQLVNQLIDGIQSSHTTDGSRIIPSNIETGWKKTVQEERIFTEDLLGDFQDVHTESSTTIPSSGLLTPDLIDDKKHMFDAFQEKDNAKNVEQSISLSEPFEKIMQQHGDTINSHSNQTSLSKHNSAEPETISHSKKNGDQLSTSSHVEKLLVKYGLDAWLRPERVESLIYWRDVKKSGVVFGAGLIILLSIACLSVISVFAYISLLTLAGTVAFRIYKSVMNAVQKTNDGHPFKEYLEFDLTLSQEKVQSFAGIAVAHLNGATAELRRLFLVEDLVDSTKFGVILWVMTYIGAWFNGITLVILAFITLFTLPKVYENNKQTIDVYLDLVRNKLTEVTDKVKAAIPMGSKKAADVEFDKDK